MVELPRRGRLRLGKWLEHGRDSDPARQTCGSYLLLQLLQDKERLALQRIFRMLYLIQPEENFRQIWVGLQSMSRQNRASSLELLENILGPDQRSRVMALVEPGSKRQRLARSGSDLAEVTLEYSELLSQMGRDQSRSLNGLAMYHAGEIELEPKGTDHSFVRERALAMIKLTPGTRPRPNSGLGVAVAADV